MSSGGQGGEEEEAALTKRDMTDRSPSVSLAGLTEHAQVLSDCIPLCPARELDLMGYRAEDISGDGRETIRGSS